MTISELSSKYEISEDTLRYYEKIGLLRNVPRTEGGIRNYDETAEGWVEFLKCMRNAGLSISVLQKYIDLYYQGDATLQERKQLLVQQRELLKKSQAQLKETIKRLDYKIDNYDQLLAHIHLD